MNNSSKVLKVVFIILLIVTVGELFYFFYFSKNAPENKIILPTINPLVQNNKQTYPEWIANIPNGGAVDKSYIGMLTKKLPIKDENLYLQIEQYGKIKDVELNGKDPKGRPFGLRFTLFNSKNEKFNVYYYNPDPRLELFRVEDNSKTAMSNFEEFKEGDTVKMLETDDISKNMSDKESVVKIELYLYK